MNNEIEMIFFFFPNDISIFEQFQWNMIFDLSKDMRHRWALLSTGNTKRRKVIIQSGTCLSHAESSIVCLSQAHFDLVFWIDTSQSKSDVLSEL